MEKGSERLRLQPSFSIYLALWLCMLHVFALGAVWTLPLHPIAKLTLSLLLIMYLAWQVRHHLLRNSKNAIREVVFEPIEGWWLIDADGSKRHVRLLPQSLVSPWLVVLSFSSGSWSMSRSLVLLPDNLDREVARKLRIHLLQLGSNEKSAPTRSAVDSQSGSVGSKGE